MKNRIIEILKGFATFVVVFILIASATGQFSGNASRSASPAHDHNHGAAESPDAHGSESGACSGDHDHGSKAAPEKASAEVCSDGHNHGAVAVTSAAHPVAKASDGACADDHAHDNCAAVSSSHGSEGDTCSGEHDHGKVDGGDEWEFQDADFSTAEAGHESEHPSAQDESRPYDPASDSGLASVFAAKCEHGPALDCEECIYEAGAVRTGPETMALLKTGSPISEIVTGKVRTSGVLELDRSKVFKVTPPVPGRVIKVIRGLGDKVEAGEVLAVIHSPEVGESKARFLKVKAAREVISRELSRQKSLQRNLENLAEDLEKGKQTLSWKGEDGVTSLGQWRARIGEAAARFAAASGKLQRERGMLSKGLTSQENLEKAVEEHATARSRVDAIIEEIMVDSRLDLLRIEREAEKTEADYNVAVHGLCNFGLSSENWETWTKGAGIGIDFACLEIRAPSDGIIVAQDFSQGEFVESSTSLYVIARHDTLWAWCSLYPADLASVSGALARGSGEGLRTTVRVTGLNASPVEGHLDLIEGFVDKATRTVRARVTVHNESGILRPGMFVTASIDLARGGERVMLLPATAVLEDGGKNFVFQKIGENLWARRDVRAGRSYDGNIEILSPIPLKGIFITSGAFMLKSDILREKMGAGCAH
ncbi:MAG: hypothetical protein CVV64_13350 [Candidatus Wallbacteria bacterium HGW-Wallbacteria-1]|jgi:cobalt-zinc-cadmium efflux system membrane fusion protein|uniref:RND efflux pump membrane fusion protein barrel-sandwich domain-containing protein n=1 Tax=Candidatus Wallbacteria bacterium HGW-Wallbacteria-1 TaxID=2013854 RepID=A0A2N1PMT5_9BACT|nr:MAG: hypothetical protein CVV64_13350 [Candidatus Wallbacteria bacterium HGW-Wallbacteria-1]